MALGFHYPPSVGWDAAGGIVTWRSVLNSGAVNTDVSADPENISRDVASEAKWFSPGQYLAPGILTLTGLRLGTAMTITTGVSLLFCLLGWIQVLDHFGQSYTAKVLTVLFIATASYSTLPFADYENGEPLLQGATPWLILIGLRAPVCSAFYAGVLAALAVFAGFFTKLSGIMVALAALIAGAFVIWVRVRRILPGMAGMTAGTAVAGLLLYFTWFRHAMTPGTGGGVVPKGGVLFAAGAPWGAGMSWLETLDVLVFRPYVATAAARQFAFLVPLAVFGTVILRRVRKPASGIAALTNLTLCFYCVYALALTLVYARGPEVGLDERHVRSAGTLILVCALAAVTSGAVNRSPRIAVLAFCGILSLCGVWFLVSALAMPPNEDRFSRTRQQVEVEAIGFARQIFAREGGNALFVITSPDTVVALPVQARILRTRIILDSGERLAKQRYAGTVKGSLCVIMQPVVVNSAKAELLLKSFSAYPYSGWERHPFGRSQVFVQHAPAP